jgi:hypothetical protein
MKILLQFSEGNKSTFLLSLMRIQGRPPLTRKPKVERGYSALEAPRALAAPVDLGVIPVSLVLPPSDLLPVCLIWLPAPPPVAPALPPTPHAAPTLVAPMPRPSPG